MNVPKWPSQTDMSIISNYINVLMSIDSDEILTKDKKITDFLEKYPLMGFFLIIFEDNSGTTHYSLHTKKQLGLDKIPPGMFSKPGGIQNFSVLKKKNELTNENQRTHEFVCRVFNF
jgi:hypothetical protein